MPPATAGHLSDLYCAVYDKSERRLITGSDDHLVKIWGVHSATLLRTLRGHEGDITMIDVRSPPCPAPRTAPPSRLQRRPRLCSHPHLLKAPLFLAWRKVLGTAPPVSAPQWVGAR